MCKYYFLPGNFVFETRYTAWLKRQNSGVHVSPGSAEILVRRCGITNHCLIAYSLSSFTAKNNWNWLICVKVIVCYIMLFCLRHSAVYCCLYQLGLGSRNSVCPSVTCMDCDKSKWCAADVLIPHERAITLLLWHQQWLVGDDPFPPKCALIPPLRKMPALTDFHL